MKRFLLLIFLCAATSTAMASDFLDIFQTCENIKLVKSSVSASCVARNGGTYRSMIRLRGIINSNGVLTQDRNSRTYSNFHNVCTDVTLNVTGMLAARCKDSNNRYRASSLDITEIVKNYNGTLVYP